MNNLIRFEPRTNLRRLQSEFDHLFDSFFPAVATDNGDRSTVWAPRVDLAENDEAYLLELDVPGLDRDQINVSFEEDRLIVSGERRSEDRTEGTEYMRVERRFGHFYRSFRLPKAVDADDISATYTDGVLRITVPKAEETKPRRISIG